MPILTHLIAVGFGVFLGCGAMVLLQLRAGRPDWWSDVPGVP